MSTKWKMDKLIVVYTYNGILLNNNVDTYNKIDESQKHANKRVHSVRFHDNLEQAKLINSNRKQINGCQGPGIYGKGTKNLESNKKYSVS